MVMENTMKEADYMNENEDAIKLTKDHMDKLNKEGHCMCDDKCLVYPEAVYGDSKKSLEVVKLVAEKDGDCIVMEKEHMDMLEKDGKCECNGVTITMSEMDDEMSEGKMCECGSGMVESECNECGGSSYMGEDDIKNPGPYMGGPRQEAGVDDDGDGVPNGADKDPKDGSVTEIKVGETTYKVVEESVNKLTEALNKTTNKEIMKEDMDFFNKIINYNKK